jgi:hypothetical protein
MCASRFFGAFGRTFDFGPGFRNEVLADFVALFRRAPLADFDHRSTEPKRAHRSAVEHRCGDTPVPSRRSGRHVIPDHAGGLASAIDGHLNGDVGAPGRAALSSCNLRASRGLGASRVCRRAATNQCDGDQERRSSRRTSHTSPPAHVPKSLPPNPPARSSSAHPELGLRRGRDAKGLRNCASCGRSP